MQQRDHLKSHVRERAGPSFKQCPHCDAVVSRNAVMCTNCKAPCSKPGHVSTLRVFLNKDMSVM